MHTSVVQQAGTRFHGDEDAFLQCFDQEVKVWFEPGEEQPLVGSRDELKAWRSRILKRYPALTAVIGEVEPHGPGVVADVVVVAPDDGELGWRYALAIGMSGERIAEVRVFWQRGSAVRFLAEDSRRP